MSIPILLIEDDPGIAQGLGTVLNHRGYTLEVIPNGQRGLKRLLEGQHHLTILDVSLPDMEGFEILRQARSAGFQGPIILLTARDTEFDKVLGFDLGVDDYITKPFSVLELLGRVQALLRRTQKTDASNVRFGPTVVDFKAYQIRQPRRTVDLPVRAFDLLRYLFQRQGQAVGRDELLDAIWGQDRFVSQRTINNLVVVLRQAIEEDTDNPQYLKTVHGIGYRLENCGA